MVSFCGNTQSRWEPRDVEHDLRVVQDNSNTPFMKITSLEDGNVIRLYLVKDIKNVTINSNFQYSMDGKTNWKSYNLWVRDNTTLSESSGDEVALDYGQSVYFRNDTGTAIAQVHRWYDEGYPSYVSYHRFQTTKKFNMSGNVMAMINYNNLGMDLPAYGLCGLFYGCKYLIDASNLKLPKVIGRDSMYRMFYGCSSLERAPILQFTSIQQFSLWSMFSGNESLSYIIWDSSCVLPKGTITYYRSNEITSGVVFYTKSDFDVETSKANLPTKIQVLWGFSPAIDSFPDAKGIEMAQSEFFISKRFNLPDWMEVSR